MLDNIRLANKEQSLECCREIFIYISDYSISDIQLGLSFVMVSLIDSLDSVSINTSIDFEIDFIGFSSDISKIETLEEIRKAFEIVIGDIIDKIRYQDLNRHNLLIDEIKSYISDNYYDYALTPNMIASEKGLTLKYVNLIFKKHTGQSIASYINQIRIEKAAKLLVESCLSIDTILDEIGWENRAYFFTLFKKQFGATPNIYRNNVK